MLQLLVNDDVLAIPTKAIADHPRGPFANVPSSVAVIDIGNHHPELRDGHIDAIDRSMFDGWGKKKARTRRALGSSGKGRGCGLLFGFQARSRLASNGP